MPTVIVRWIVLSAPMWAATAGVQAQGPAASAESRLLAPPLSWFEAWMEETGEKTPDFASMKSWADLPPLLRFEDGLPVRTTEDWGRRRAELRRLLCDGILGHVPEEIPALAKAEIVRTDKLAGGARREVRLTYATRTTTVPEVAITIELQVPDGTGPFPVFMTQSTHRRVGLIGLARGYLVCVYPGGDGNDQGDKFAEAYPKADWGRLTRRAWLASRVLDYLVTLPEVRKDQIALTGHSRNGKQTMIAAALDERFTAVVSSSSGTGGDSPFRFVSETAFEESVEFMSRQQGTADWFHPRIRMFTGREDKLPTDIHALAALIAPRFCLLSTACNDDVTTTFAVERNYVANREVYRLLGKPEALRIRWREGSHEWNAQDAESYFDWFDRAFGRNAFEFPEQLFHAFDWSEWKAKQVSASLSPPTGQDARQTVLWALGEPPASGIDPGGTYSREVAHESALMGRDDGKPKEVTRLAISFGHNVRGDLFYRTNIKDPMPCVIWLHPYSFSSGYTGGYMLGPRIHNSLAQKGYAVLAFDQLGFGRRLAEGRDFYGRYPRWSKLGKMVADVRAAVDFLTGKGGPAGPGQSGIELPPTDPGRIFCVGYSLGGTVALYSAALDDRITGIASFAGFTPMRTDTDAKPTGGLRRLWEWHGLIPRLGLFHGRERELPYDCEDLLAMIAPRPCLIVSPIHDREASLSDITACVAKARAWWESKGAPAALTHLTPDDYNRFQGEQQQTVADWLKQSK
ncbi:MAG TPA: alpha/beta fold hydrolase [Phycisphaerae bacterium]|nr:alpha/beta fold hydrolase [Phycisphaerae bacterium]HRY67466.1 alpha/beta fold hydrolase [Phycisphaerae bacterium]HSA27941.1 alpha/beta fold hydrolase [Phycisphaerae bacterium]